MFKSLNKKLFGKLIRMSEQKIIKSRVAGHTLLSILFFMLALALIGKPAMDFYDAWKEQKAATNTNERIAVINKALSNYVSANGRYPCPAPITAGFDTATFGKEVNNCGSASTGITISQGRDDLAVAAGAVPVRTLGLPDETIYDGYNHRYIYTVTQGFTTTSPKPALDSTRAAIRLVDDANTVATRENGNIIFAVTSLGDDIVGAYNREGFRAVNCTDTEARSFENCNMDATLVNTINKSYVEGNQKFTQTTRFKSAPPCVNAFNKPPTNIAYLLDTSGSMNTKIANKTCEGINAGPGCTRMDAAQWALRRCVALRQIQTKGDESYSTEFSGFVRPFEGIKDLDLTLKQDEKVDDKLEKMCPTGNTPLGDHIEVLAERVGEGTLENPNSIMIFSDGLSNSGKSPATVAKEIFEKYKGKLIVHIIDMRDDLSKPEQAMIEANIVNATDPPNTPENEGARYFNASSPEDIRDFCMKLSGTCNEEILEEPEDPPHCK